MLDVRKDNMIVLCRTKENACSTRALPVFNVERRAMEVQVVTLLVLTEAMEIALTKFGSEAI
jgi:hypothetical protein